MKKVQVVTAGGATLVGPVKLKLTKEQHRRRAHILGDFAKNGLYELDGGRSVMFKHGEELGVDKLSKLSTVHFDEVGKGKAAKSKPATVNKATTPPKSEQTSGTKVDAAASSEGADSSSDPDKAKSAADD